MRALVRNIVLLVAGLGMSGASAAAVSVDATSLCAVVDAGASVSLAYYQDPADAEVRRVDAYAVGYTNRDNLVLFGRQTSGYSASAVAEGNDLPGWRRFRFDRIRHIDSDGTSFMAVFVDPEETLYLDVICSNPILGKEG